MPPRFVNMVERTQTAHLPDPIDPLPVEQGIGVYFTGLDYGGISFAMLEDRKFKSSPAPLVPEGEFKNGWPHAPDFDPATGADVEGAVLLGERQLSFLRHWAADWSNGTWMKVALSQTIFANVATIPENAKSGSVLPGLKTPLPGEYPPGYKLATDADSNGWPQSGRNRALRELRKARALHVAGDQHLGSTVRYGIDAWDDAGWAVCVPSVANAWPRRWFPPSPGSDRREGAPPYTGRYLDGFGNHITVHAVSNPVVTGLEPARLHDHAPGYGIIRFDRKTRAIEIACWPRAADPRSPGAWPYPGWPVRFKQSEGDGRKRGGYLPTVTVTGLNEPVLQIYDEGREEVLYTLRMRGSTFRPHVFKAGTYTLRIGEPGTERWKEIPGLSATFPGDDRTLHIRFD